MGLALKGLKIGTFFFFLIKNIWCVNNLHVFTETQKQYHKIKLIMKGHLNEENCCSSFMESYRNDELATIKIVFLSNLEGR